MQFVDLSRTFVKVKTAENMEWESSYFGKRYGGWSDWEDVLKLSRVIVLAEAGSGKSEELRHYAERLHNLSKPAFYMTVQSVAEDGVYKSLLPAQATEYENWRDGTEIGTLFVDSVDEAQLSHINIQRCLRSLAHDLGGAIDRCRLIFSCRGSDWDWENGKSQFDMALSSPVKKATSPGDPLLDPVFSDNDNMAIDDHDDEQDEGQIGFKIMMMNALDGDQQLKLAEHAGLTNAPEFFRSLDSNGLQKFTDRPKDLLDYVEYWRQHGRLGTRREMIEVSIENKLTELKKGRRDQSVLSNERSRQGAERLAAAMVFGKTTSLKFDVSGPGLEEASTTIDPRRIFTDWTEEEVSTLLRRALFAPATFGKSRFHHRESQEYLAACWVKSLLDRGCPKQDVDQLFFATQYGSRTLIPSRRATAGWLANIEPSWIDKILETEPLVLLQHGDPGSLHLVDKEKLLRLYAVKHRDSDIGDDGIANRSLWMFADKKLSKTIVEVWDECDQIDFRSDLLRLIAEGEIADCKDLVVKVFNDEREPNRLRVWALEASESLNADTERQRIAAKFMASAPKLPNRLAVSFARSLYPVHLTTGALFDIIETSKPMEKSSVGGFGYELSRFWSSCPTEHRLDFAERLAQLCLGTPHLTNYHRVSKQYRFLAKHLDPIVHDLLLQYKGKLPPAQLIKLLMVMERRQSSSHYDSGEFAKRIANPISENHHVRRALLWADVEETREHDDDEDSCNRYWRMYLAGNRLHFLSSSDHDWLLEDASTKKNKYDRQLALSAILAILPDDDQKNNEIQSIRRALAADADLMSMIDDFLSPPKLSKADLEHRKWEEKQKLKEAASKAQTKSAWREHQALLVKNPEELLNQKTRYHHIHWLIYWLSRAEKSGRRDPIASTEKLAEAFSPDVREKFHVALKTHWRETEPKRPVRKPGKGITEKWIHIHAATAVEFEFHQDKKAFASMPKHEIRRAVRHLIFGERHEAVMMLAQAHPDIVWSLLKSEVNREWSRKNGSSESQLYYLAHYKGSLPLFIAKHVSALLLSDSTDQPRLVELAAQTLMSVQNIPGEIVWKLDDMKELYHKFIKDKPNEANYILALIFQHDFGAGLDLFEHQLKRLRSKNRYQYVESVVGSLFDSHHHGLCLGALQQGSPAQLFQLAEIAHKNIRYEEDVVHEGSFTPDSRDAAEAGRGAILTALRDLANVEAYSLSLKFAEKYPKHKHWMRQNARKMLERDSEQQAWTELEFRIFAERFIQPIKYGTDLLRAAWNVLKNVDNDWREQDFSPQYMVQKYIGEPKVRDELSLQLLAAEAIRVRASSNFHIHREPIVAEKKEPDIIASATSSPVQVAIEIKQADHWSYTQLKTALIDQLVGQYLRPSERKNGILLLINTRHRKWQVQSGERRRSFDDLVRALQKLADTQNASGNIEGVRVFGIDLAAGYLSTR